MSRFFARNIDWRGRLARGLGGLVLFGAAIYCRVDWPWLGFLLGMAGLFCLLQAISGWCLARACGFQTKL